MFKSVKKLFSDIEYIYIKIQVCIAYLEHISGHIDKSDILNFDLIGKNLVVNLRTSIDVISGVCVSQTKFIGGSMAISLNTDDGIITIKQKDIISVAVKPN